MERSNYVTMDFIFIDRVSTLAWYPSMDLGDICSDLIIPRRPLFIYSVRFRSNFIVLIPLLITVGTKTRISQSILASAFQTTRLCHINDHFLYIASFVFVVILLFEIEILFKEYSTKFE